MAVEVEGEEEEEVVEVKIECTRMLGMRTNVTETTIEVVTLTEALIVVQTRPKNSNMGSIK